MCAPPLGASTMYVAGAGGRGVGADGTGQQLAADIFSARYDAHVTKPVATITRRAQKYLTPSRGKRSSLSTAPVTSIYDG